MPHDPQNTIDAFCPLDAPALDVVDRSTLELWAACPHSARLLEAGVVNSNSAIAAAGNEVHAAYSAAIAEYLDARGSLAPRDIADAVYNNLYGSRPDVQPEAIEAGRRMAWQFAAMLHQRHPENVLRFDGGEGELSGQLAWDLPQFNLRATSELDLLYAGPDAPAVLNSLDWKSGWKPWSAVRMRQSFQFGMHAWLVFKNYPSVQVLRVEVWATRRNRTYACEFTREELSALSSRVATAAGIRYQYKNEPPARVPTWPLVEKCAQCSARLQCPIQFEPEVRSYRGHLVDRMAALEAILDHMRDLAGQYVDATGRDLVSPLGNAYGTGKPKGTAPRKGLYRSTASDDHEE